MLKKLLITGAAGNLGREMRTRLKPICETMRLSDFAEMAPAGENEEIVMCDIGDKAAVEDLVAGCDGIVHFGGKAVEGTWSVIRNANLDGVFNLYEAARKHGKPRIVFASSNHAVGFYRQDQVIDNSVYPQPDGLYGVSKVFGEMMASMYYNKYGIETASIRIGSCFEKPTNHRHLSTWLSHADLARLLGRIFDVPKLGCPVIYGKSDNTATFWDNSRVNWMAWKPEDSADGYRAEIDAAVAMPPADAPDVVHQGGTFTVEDIHEE